jgi:hypothetical protein
MLGAGAALVLVAVLVASWRRPSVPLATKLLGLMGMLLLAAAAGTPVLERDRVEPVVVMVDLSPSTRGARYRDAESLRGRIRGLLGDAPYRTFYFAGGEARLAPGQSASAGALTEVPTRRTVFLPPSGDTVLLFSDCRFEPPAVAPRTHVAIDPALEDPADAAVERLEVRGAQVVVTVRNTGGDRTLSISGLGESANTSAVPPGGIVVSRPLPRDRAFMVTARLSTGDAWPENDALTLVRPPPADTPSWWIGAMQRSSSEDWRYLAPHDLPVDTGAYLSPPAIVLDNVSSSDLTDAQRQRLRQYVRDLGGGLLIVGGDRAFAAGGYFGTALDALSPLASHPPLPSTHWVFLVDSSGSMNAPSDGGGTRWRAAVDAVAAAVPSLPPHDLVSVAGFAAALQWWSRATPAGELRAGALPPAGAYASGPTELRRALAAAATAGGDGAAVELVVLTDANAPVEGPAELAAIMTQHKVRLHLLDLGEPDATGLANLREVVRATGGTHLRESDPRAWAMAVRRLTRAAAPDPLVRGPARVRFGGALSGTPDRAVAPPWNRTWLKPEASPLGEMVTAQGPAPADAAQAGRVPGGVAAAAAVWGVGEGHVAAAAFAAGGGNPPADVGGLVRVVARPPRDPRIRVEWNLAAQVRVRVDAVDRDAEGAQHVINALPLTLELREATPAESDAAPLRRTVPQVGPGLYELAVEAPNVPSVATLRQAGRAVDCIAVGGRSGAEYDGVGNDRRTMRELAERSGGSVVDPAWSGPLRLPSGARAVPLTSPVATVAAACLALALVWWRAT